jgi:hypothetical protein
MSITTKILWVVYIGLLLVLLPHTAWAFESMEPQGGKITAWIAAIAFESAIAVLTHKLAKHIETTAKIKGRWSRFAARYFNPFAFGLGMATIVSALANLAHAVEFGKPLAIFTQWGIPQSLYSFAFGGVLPVVSLIFARVLSDVVDTEEAPNPELDAAKATIQDLRRKFAESEQHRKAAEGAAREREERAIRAEDKLRTTETRANAAEASWEKAEARAKLAEDRFGAMGDLFHRIFSEDKRERILAVREWMPKLPGAAIAIITESSPAYVSEVINSSAVPDEVPQHA